jgi:hypothetical protein
LSHWVIPNAGRSLDNDGYPRTMLCCKAIQRHPPPTSAAPGNASTLQADRGTRTGDVHLSSQPDQVLWAYAPNVHALPGIGKRFGQTITIDAHVP